MGLAFEPAKLGYHEFVPGKDFYRIEGANISDPYKYSESVLKSPLLQPIQNFWRSCLEEPFRGITNDGLKREALYELQDEGAPNKNMVVAALKVLDMLAPEEKEQVVRGLDSEVWRQWSNPEFIIYNIGVRLEHLDSAKIEAILELVEQSLSKNGFAKIRAAMKTNKFLGEICSREKILNEHSYSFTLFGEPSETQPWGYLLFGHHLCLNVTVVGSQMVIGPVFLGAEPCIIDYGPDKGTELCGAEGDLGFELMVSLSAELQKKAQIYKQMHDPAMPKERWNPADQRHLAGAFQDNRVIGYEGVVATEMSSEQQDKLMDILAAFFTLPPAAVLEHRLRHVRKHLSETYFSWIGGYGPTDPIYYRIQSPVVLVEFDHHSGVFLTNDEPGKYHIHTIQRLPNGNDYARELIHLFREQSGQT